MTDMSAFDINSRARQLLVDIGLKEPKGDPPEIVAQYERLVAFVADHMRQVAAETAGAIRESAAKCAECEAQERADAARHYYAIGDVILGDRAHLQGVSSERIAASIRAISISVHQPYPRRSVDEIKAEIERAHSWQADADENDETYAIERVKARIAALEWVLSVKESPQ